MHGIIAAFIVTVFFLLFFVFYDNLNNQLKYIASILLSTNFVVLLQGVNESFQAIDNKLIKKYGSLENFQKNSKRDWKYTLLGLFLSLLINSLIYSFFI